MKAKKIKNEKIIIGIDEAGRGPLAGPVSVGAVVFNGNNLFFKGIKDSKKMSEKKREEWFLKIKNNFYFSVAMVGEKIIDKKGISFAVKIGINRVLKNLIKNKLKGKKPDIVLLDGLLKAPKIFNQKTIIKGDEKIPIISAASIMAKVKRDRKMKKMDKIFPDYGFKIHKGYGTKLHYEMLKKKGVSKIHRKTYLANF